MAALPLAELGLAPLTLQRLRKLDLGDCAALMRMPPEDLWRRLGRTALVDVVQRLRHHGLPVPALNAQQLWRLGLGEPAPACVRAEPHAPFESLWPRVGNVLRAALHERGFDTLIEAAPRNRDDVRLLYRLGRIQLRLLRDLFSEAADRADDGDARILEQAVALVDAWMEGARRGPRHPAPTGASPVTRLNRRRSSPAGRGEAL